MVGARRRHGRILNLAYATSGGRARDARSDTWYTLAASYGMTAMAANAHCST